MTYLLIALVGAAIAWALYAIVVVMRGMNYHAAVRDAVVADLGAAALLKLESRPVIERIAIMQREGRPVASTASEIKALIGAEERGFA